MIALVHGNPETGAIWDPLVEALDRDVTRLSPPGFGAPVPDGFDVTPAGYRDWLIGELEALGEPVHLLGHDVGGGHVVRVAAARPDLIRTWASDAIGTLHPGYVWHELAQLWQSSPAGEEWIAAQLAATPEERARRTIGRGMAPEVARRIAPAFDATMGETILRLYRAARLAPATDLRLAARRPGLVLLATADVAVGTETQRREAAATAGARVAVLEGGGHWWLTQPAQLPTAVAALTEHWAA